MALNTQGVAGPCTGTLQVSADNFTTCVGLTLPQITNGATYSIGAMRTVWSDIRTYLNGHCGTNFAQ